MAAPGLLLVAGCLRLALHAAAAAATAAAVNASLTDAAEPLIAFYCLSRCSGAVACAPRPPPGGRPAARKAGRAPATAGGLALITASRIKADRRRENGRHDRWTAAALRRRQRAAILPRQGHASNVVLSSGTVYSRKISWSDVFVTAHAVVCNGCRQAAAGTHNMTQALTPAGAAAARAMHKTQPKHV